MKASLRKKEKKEKMRITIRFVRTFVKDFLSDLPNHVTKKEIFKNFFLQKTF